MNLDDSFNGVCTSLLTQPTKPSFNTIHSILGLSTHIVHPDIPVLVKAEEQALAVKFSKRGHKRMEGSPSRGDSSGNWRDRSDGGGMKDKRGYCWCDTANNHHCRHCGHTGHNATCCTVELPLKIKAWVLGSAGKEDHSMALRIIGVDEDFEDSEIKEALVLPRS
ncbi:hypothetical protein PILCRDRAFT_16514 [Piloderma croceum F 1598]|uniref:Uncharacterized protein n=1 Tax=Piloderma croceum (strain F 1598) TaxID=765440 RepID=A0A0C3ADZ7_PILCF|nr:hypothetical protein PILCRDRAFT_16514 [Piloderma croceum F 1598]